MENKENKEIIVIGAGLTGLTIAFYLQKKGIRVHILEKDNRPGGQIRTYENNGFIYESGPNTGAVSNPEVAELFNLLHPDCELETAREESKRRLIWKGNRFHELPSGIWGGLTTPLFSWYDKLRILGEPYRAKGTDPYESVGSLTIRRLGKSYLDYAVDPFVSGIYAGDPMKLTTQFALPKLYNLEQQYGSFIKGGVAKARAPKTDRERLATKKVFSVKGGLSRLTEALVKQIGSENITLSARNITIRPEEGKWQISYQTSNRQQTIVADKVVTTTGAYTLPEMLPFIPEDNIKPVCDLKYAPIVQVSVGIKNPGDLSFKAFGGLVPSREKRDVLGILFPSACFEDRCPPGGSLFSFFMGGVKREDMLTKTDREIEELILREMNEMLKFPKGFKPDMLQIFRHQRAIPQYGSDSRERLQAIAAIEAQYPGLVLAGNIRNGIGMADRIRQGTEIASALASFT